MNAQTLSNRSLTGLPEPVAAAVSRQGIVLVVSPITDTGMITRWLDNHEQDYQRVELNMRSPESRAALEQLRKVTRWRSLPQIFMQGEFIGGTQAFFDAVEPQDKLAPRPRQATDHSNPWASRLGYAGLIPFFSLALLALFGAESQAVWARQAMLAYGAVILSFAGALHWVRGLDASNPVAAARLLIVSVLPSLIGWFALLMPASIGLMLLAFGFGALYVHDRQAWRLWPWFLSLRTHLTAGAISSLLIVWVGGHTLI